MLILFLLMVGAGILTHIVPGGAFDRTLIDGREAIVPGSFAFTGNGVYPVWRWLTAPIEVLWSDDAVTVIMIILFICIIGGTFTVLDKSGMLRYIMNSLVRRFEQSKYRLMAVLTLFFMLFGSVFGIFEELVALVPIVIMLSHALGWDSLVGLGMSALAAGFGDGFTNLLYPTNAVLMITLGLTVVSYPKWFQWTIGLQLLMLAVNILLLLLAVFIGYGA